MTGVPAGLPAGVRVSDHISLGVIDVVAWMIYKFINVVSYARSRSWAQNGIDHFELGDFSELL